MKNEDIYLDLENFEIEDIEEVELNIDKKDNKDIFEKALNLIEEDKTIDSNSEKDYIDGIEGAEETIFNDPLSTLDDNIEIISEESILNSLAIVDHNKIKTEIEAEALINDLKGADATTIEEPVRLREDVKEDVKIIEEPIKEEKSKEEPIKEEKSKEEPIKEEKPLDSEDLQDTSFTDEKKKKKKPKKEKMKKEKIKKEKKEENKKLKMAQIIFCVASLIFIISCFAFYTPRLIKYYKIYNPKTESGTKTKLLSSSIIDANTIETEKDGLYKSGSGYAFKGANVNNYVKVGKHLFRVIKTNSDGSVDLVMDSPIGSLKWNNEAIEFLKSDLYNYLNNEFVKELDKDLLTTITTCEDLVEGLNDIKCEKQNNEGFVRVLGVTEYLNSSINGATFITNEYEMWLYNQSSLKPWLISGNNIIEGNFNENYYIKPVIRLKNSTSIESGKGTLASPYIIGEKQKTPNIGEFVKLGEDMYTVVRNDKKLTYLAKIDNLTTTFRFDLNKNVFDPSAEGSIASYLNNTYLSTLSYKDLIKEGTYYTGAYTNSYKDIIASKVKAKVGMLSILDTKVNIKEQAFYLINGSEDLYVNYFNAGTILDSKITLSKNIKPVIAIDYNILKTGKGTSEEPLTTKE